MGSDDTVACVLFGTKINLYSNLADLLLLEWCG